MLDIKRALSDNGIHYVESGPNTKKGEISIHCPLCGNADPSQHLGIDPNTGFWACWRNKKHSGKNLIRLFQILGIPYIEDKSDTLKKLINRTYFSENEVVAKHEKQKFTKLPIEFISIADDSVFSKMYIGYLSKRGFGNSEQARQVAINYKLCRSLAADKWITRLIIPIFVNDEISWTARAIGDNPLRYLSPLETEGKNIKETVFNYNELTQATGDALVITEGPLDAMKVDCYTKPSVRATCIFGLTLSEDQIRLLDNICPNFGSILIGLDEGTLAQSLNVSRALHKFNPVIMKLPKKDLGEMSKEEIHTLLERYL